MMVHTCARQGNLSLMLIHVSETLRTVSLNARHEPGTKMRGARLLVGSRRGMPTSSPNGLVSRVWFLPQSETLSLLTKFGPHCPSWPTSDSLRELDLAGFQDGNEGQDRDV